MPQITFFIRRRPQRNLFFRAILHSTMAIILEDLASLDEWCKQWAMKFPDNKSAVPAYECHVPLAGSS